jgi:STAS-like domain of unknown function (DUF4325)
MKHEIKIADKFGSRLSSGERAYPFRVSEIDPYITLCDSLVLDFTGVRSANSSFINALVSGLFEDHGAKLLKQLTFKGCLPTVKVLLNAAISLGMSKHAEQHH